jgi:hypothetical protein
VRGGSAWDVTLDLPDVDGDFCGDSGTTVDCYVAADLE